MKRYRCRLYGRETTPTGLFSRNDVLFGQPIASPSLLPHPIERRESRRVELAGRRRNRSGSPLHVTISGWSEGARRFGQGRESTSDEELASEAKPYVIPKQLVRDWGKPSAGMFDIYKLFNASTVLAINTRYGQLAVPVEYSGRAAVQVRRPARLLSRCLSTER